MIHHIISSKLNITCTAVAHYRNYQENIDLYTKRAVHDFVLILLINALNLMEGLGTVASKEVNKILCSSLLNC